MKHSILLALALFVSSSLFAQNAAVNELVEAGIVEHDKGNFKKALKLYKKALKIDPQSSLVLYEIALTYFHTGDYKKTSEYATKVLDQKNDHSIGAYVIKGSALDEMGKVKESIKLFRKGIREFPNEHLLHFNLAVNYYKIGKLEDCEDALFGSLGANKFHPGSHLLLMNVHKAQGNDVKAMMSAYYFLSLEPTSVRAEEAYNYLVERCTVNEMKKTGDNEFSIELDMNLFSSDNDFKTVKTAMGIKDLMIKGIKEKEPDDYKGDFYEVTKYFFNMLETGEAKDDFWKDLYIADFTALMEEGHIEAFTHWIRFGYNKKSKKWADNNPDEMDAYLDWGLSKLN